MPTAPVLAGCCGSRAALFDGDRDLGGAGVDGVFDEFLDDVGGTFEDLAGGDLSGDVGRQNLNVHGASFGSARERWGKLLRCHGMA